MIVSEEFLKNSEW